MAKRVRFHSLTLAGFGRYDRPTRFDLAGRSCTFTSPNELGKSTFHAGLIATLFGPPAIRAKAAAFQSRFRSWNGPIAFMGELEFSVSGEHWRIRQDFDALETKVWRVNPEGNEELRHHSKGKSGRSPADQEQYEQLLRDCLGLSDRSLYETMFTISQESALLASWRIDARIASLNYGPAIERLGDNLHALFDRFREITRNTREYQISVGSQGERNGRSEGRLDHVLARIVELEARLEAARARTQSITKHREELTGLEATCQDLRGKIDETSRSLENWRAWIELESPLQPAVESYERLSTLHLKCQQVTGPLAELRSRLATELAVFDQAPEAVAEKLEYYPLQQQAAADAKEQYERARLDAERCRAEIAELDQSLHTSYQTHIGRPELADQVEELRVVLQEIGTLERKLHDLTQAAGSGDGWRVALERELESRSQWRVFAESAPGKLQETRLLIDRFITDHDRYCELEGIRRSEEQWLSEQDARISEEEESSRPRELLRQRQRASLELASESAQRSADEAAASQVQLRIARQDLERRYADFAGAPVDLPLVWEQLRDLDRCSAEARRNVDKSRVAVRVLQARRIWRRGLATGGIAVMILCLLLNHGLLGGMAALAVASACISLRWLYPMDPTQINEVKRWGQRSEAESLRIGKERDQIVARLGSKFVVPPEREAEWRRLWPTYRKELEQLDEQARSLPSEQNIQELTQKLGTLAAELERHDAESAELADEAAVRIQALRAERDRRRNECERITEEMDRHLQDYFSELSTWRDLPLASLPAWWGPILELASAANPTLTRTEELVNWCRSLDESAWSGFHEVCLEVRRLSLQLAPDPVEAAAREAAAREVHESLDTLRGEERRRRDAIRPFTVDTDPGWLREMARASQATCQMIADKQRVLDGMPNLEELERVYRSTASELEELQTELGPVLERFPNPADALARLGLREGLVREMRSLERQAAELLAESGYESLEQLAHEAGKAEGLVGTIRAESQELVARASELWEAVGAAPELAPHRARDLDTLLSELQSTCNSSEAQRAELAATIRQMEADSTNDAGAIETELELLRGERVELEKRRDQLATEFKEASRLLQELQRVERTALEGRITAYFADFSRTSGRRVELNEDLNITVRNEDGQRYSPDQLSHGARDQLYLAVYLATTASFDLPYVLDDPFVNCDTERLAAIRACWERLIPDHQLILLSHDPQLASWAPTLEVRHAA